MEAVVLLLILLSIGVLLGALFGWIALFKVVAAQREVRALQDEVARLRRGAAAPQAAPERAPSDAARPTSRALPPPTVQTPLTPPAPKPAAAPTPTSEVETPETETPAPERASPTPALPPIAAQSRRGPEGGIFAALERSLAGNWLVWVASLALALGGVFLVKYALDRGFIGPWARVGAAAAAGAAMVAAGEWMRRRGFTEGARGRSAAPAATAGAGVIVLYGAVYAAFALYQLIPAPVAFAALAIVAAGAVALALAHGPALVALGLVGAFAAPMLIGSDEPNAPALFAYVFAVAAAGLAVTRLVGRRWPALIALAGGAIWPFLWLAGAYDDAQAWALALYLPALFVAALAFAWNVSAQAPRLSATKGLVSDAPVSVTATYLAAFAVFALLQLLADTGSYRPEAITAVAATCVIALFAAWRREALLGLPLLAVGAAAMLVYAWPEARTGVIDAATVLARAVGENAGPEGPPYLMTLIAFAALFGVGGLIAQDRLQVKGAMAAASAAGPNLMLAIGYWRVTGLDQDARWALAAAALALACTMLIERTARRPHGLESEPGPASAYALGAGAAAGMAVGMALDQLWMSVGFAMLAPIAALLHVRFRLPALVWAAVAFALLALARLTIFGEAFEYDVGAAPILNWLLLGYGVPVIAIWAAARLFERDGMSRDSAVVQTLEGAALILGVSLVSMQIRHLMNDGWLDAPYFDDSLVEAGLQSAAWLGCAVALRWRLGPHLRFAHRWLERALIVLGLGQTVLVQLWFFNPWWGADPDFIDGPFLFNALAICFAVPGVLAAVYATIARRQGYARIGTASGLTGAALLFAWFTLEIRRAFHAPDLSAAPVTDAEGYAYSAAWIVFAFALLGLGALRRRPSLRYAALSLLAVVTVKVFFWDTTGLSVLLRGVSFISLGAALMTVIVLYQRFTSKSKNPPQTSDDVAAPPE